MRFIKNLLSGKRPKRISHPVIGKAFLVESEYGSYWQAEPQVAGRRFSLAIYTIGCQEPTEPQIELFQRYARDMAVAFAKASALLIGEYEKNVLPPFPASWQEASQLVGMSVPLDADETNPWDLSFECLHDRRRSIYTCSFEAGTPTEVRFDR